MVAAYKNNNTHSAHLQRRRTAVAMQSSNKRLLVESHLLNRILISSRTESANYSEASIICMDDFFFVQGFCLTDIFSNAPVRNRVARSYNLREYKRYSRIIYFMQFNNLLYPIYPINYIALREQPAQRSDFTKSVDSSFLLTLCTHTRIS
jgi:hypothetical protein